MQIVRQLMAKLFAIQLPRGIPLAQSQSQSFRFHFEECPSTNRTKAAVLMYACISSACSLLLVRTCVYGNYGNCLVWASASRLFAWLRSHPTPTRPVESTGSANPTHSVLPDLDCSFPYSLVVRGAIGLALTLTNTLSVT